MAVWSVVGVALLLVAPPSRRPETAAAASPPSAAAPTPAPTPPAVGCPAAGATPGTPAGWSARAPVTAAGSATQLDAAALPLGRGVDATLRPIAAVAFAAPPGRAAGPAGQAGMLALVIDGAGTYAVGLSAPAWIDVVDARGGVVASSAHGHGAACSGLLKVVDFPLAPGRYVVQLSTGGEPTVGVIAFRR